MLLAFIAVKARQGEWTQSNIFDLLPRTEYDANVERAVERTQSEFSSRLIFLVGHADWPTALSAGAQLAQTFEEHPLVESVDARIEDDRITEVSRFYYNYRRQMLTPEQIAGIEADGGEAAQEQALAQVFSLAGNADPRRLTSDPFFLFPESLSALRSDRDRLQLRDGFLFVEHDAMQYLFIAVKTDERALASSEQAELVTDLQTSVDALLESTDGLTVLATGFALYAHEGTQSAKGEISVIGTGSIIGIVLLVLVVFRSLRPLGLAVLSIACGCITAMAFTLLMFGSIHLFTLIIGSSLIGVSIDYAFHFISESAFAGKERTARRCIQAIFPGITLGLVTSTVAYLALLVAPFPGLKQLAVFSATGLIGAYVTLIALSGTWAMSPAISRRSKIRRLCSVYLGAWALLGRRRALVLVGLLALLAGLAIPNLRVDDSVSLLQSRPADLVAQEEQIVDILGSVPGGTFVLVTAADTERLLMREEAARERLDALIASGELDGYQAVSLYVPSMARQTASESAYDLVLERQLGAFYGAIGLDSRSAEEVSAQIMSDSGERVSVESWLQTQLADDLQFLWFGENAGGAMSIMQLQGSADLSSLAAVLEDEEGVSIVDRQSDLSGLFAAYRVRVSWLLLAAYTGIALLLSLRYGPKRSIVVLLPPVVAGLLALAGASIFGGPINLFSILALVLVLGIGIDFTLFMAEARGNVSKTMFAISLSTITTLLSFGLLSLSATYAVRSFGLTILVGIALAFLLSPLASLWPTMAADDGGTAPTVT